jgi:peptide/nickel transport system substrate-binding protein
MTRPRVIGGVAAGPVAVALLALGLTAGCRPGGGAAAGQRPERDLDAAAAAPRAVSDRPGGTLRLVTGAVDSMDPTRSYSPGLWNVMRLYTRQLVTYAPRPGEAGTTVVPDLATALGKPTDGGRTWTYTLRPGLRWDDGKPVTASDVKYGIERQFASDLLSGGPAGWVVPLLDDRTAPYDGPFRDTTPGHLGLRSVTTPNAGTIVFHLVRPFADWDRVMALPTNTPVPEPRDTGAQYADTPASLGPYVLRGPDGHGTVVFTRNRFWTRAGDPVRSALPARVELATNLVPAERDRRLLAGQADADVSGSGLQPEGAAQVLGDAGMTARADDPTTGTVRLLAMPGSVAPLDDLHCRRAVQYALDKGELKESVGGDHAAAVATTLWPRSLPGYPAVAPYPNGDANHGDLDAAKRELALCGQPTGFSATLATVTDGRSPVLAASTAVALGRVGIKVTVRKFPRNQFLSTVAGSPAAVSEQRFGLILAEWSADFPSPYAFLDPLGDSRIISDSGNPNLAAVRDPAVDKGIDRASVALDPVQATAAWRAVEARLMTAAWYAPLIEDRALLYGSDRLRNVYVQPVYRGYDLATLAVG